MSINVSSPTAGGDKQVMGDAIGGVKGTVTNPGSMQYSVVTLFAKVYRKSGTFPPNPTDTSQQKPASDVSETRLKNASNGDLEFEFTTVHGAVGPFGSNTKNDDNKVVIWLRYSMSSTGPYNWDTLTTVQFNGTR